MRYLKLFLFLADQHFKMGLNQAGGQWMGDLNRMKKAEAHNKVIHLTFKEIFHNAKDL